MSHLQFRGQILDGVGVHALASALSGAVGLLSALGMAAPAHAAPDRADQAATALVGQMTLEEKASQLISSSPEVSRIGIPRNEWWTEALHGVQSRDDTTNFPAPIGLAATFDDRLLKQAAGVIGDEAVALHANARAAGEVGMFGNGGALDVWAPNINIFRDPRWGRGQETYGEDPYLTARMGVAYVEGVQGSDPKAPRLLATPKHFAVHSGPEPTRRSADVKVSAHDLEDTYLPAFRAVIVDAHAGSVMCSYNAVNGQPACASDYLLKTKLRGDWGFTGYVTTDCGAVEALATKHKLVPDMVSAVAASVKAGVDLQCIHPNQKAAAHDYVLAVEKGLLAPADIDHAAARLIAARIRVGDIAPDGKAIIPLPQTVLSDAHRALALHTAQESIVLLKNNGLLPLLDRKLKIVVTGPLADAVRVLRGSYSSPNVPNPITVLAGIRAQFPDADIRYVPAAPSYTDGDRVPLSALRTTDGAEGLSAKYYEMKAADAAQLAKVMFTPGGPAFEELPFKSAVVDRVGQDSDAARKFYKAVYSGVLIAPESGTYRLGLKGMFSKLTFDGAVVANLRGYPPPQLGDLKIVHLEKGHAYPLQIEANKTYAFAVDLVWSRVSDDPAAALRDAASDADLIVAAVGINSDLESEESGLVAPGFSHGDRTTLDLPADQQALLEAAKATGKRLAVVNLSGSAMNLSWAQDHADAVLQAWYPGEAGGTAIAQVLAGAVNPAGRLPVTFYRDVASLPAFDDYAMAGRTYRYFTGKPLYPFGYGLSYTRFRHGAVLAKRASAKGGLTVRASITNTGPMAGDEVAQLNLNFPKVPGVPNLALRGFQRVHLAPNETRAVSFTLSPRDLSTVSAAGERRVLPGTYGITVGGGQPGTGAAGAGTTVTINHEIPVDK